MLFAEYAVDPKLLSNFDDFRFYWSLFGWEKGRLICEYPKKWKKMVIQSLNCQPVKKKTIIERIRREDRFVRRKGSSFDSDLDWLENILILNGVQEFKSILLKQFTIDSDLPINAKISEEIIDESDLPYAGEELVARKPEAFLAALSLLLLESKKILIIDPYLDLRKPRFSSTIDILLDFLQRESMFDSLNIEFHIFDSDKPRIPSPEYLIEGIREKLRSKQKEKFSFSIHVWKADGKKEELHNRRILTDKWGVVFPYGTDTSELEQARDEVKRLSSAQYRVRWQEYAVDRNAHKYCERLSGPIFF